MFDWRFHRDLIGWHIAKPTSLPACATAIAALLALVVTVARLSFQVEQEMKAAELAEIKAKVAERETLRSKELNSAPYINDLPDEPQVQTLANAIRIAGSELDLNLVSIVISRAGSTNQSLGRTHITFVLRGSYSQLREAIAKITEDRTRPIIEQISLTNTNEKRTLEARVQLLLISRSMSSARR